MLFAGSPAAADTTAVYANKSKTIPMTMTVEIGNDGSVRYQMSMGRTYGLVVNGTDYFVEVGAKGPVVDRAEDLVTAQKEAMALFMPALKEHDTSTGPQLVPIGTVSINGRTGQAYGYKAENKGTSSPAIVVVSKDPDLAELGKAMSRQFSTSLTMFSRMVGNAPGMFSQMKDILQSGAPLSFAGMELQSINHAPVDATRFELPAQPETLDQIRERMKPLPPPPTALMPKS